MAQTYIVTIRDFDKAEYGPSEIQDAVIAWLGSDGVTAGDVDVAKIRKKERGETAVNLVYVQEDVA